MSTPFHPVQLAVQLDGREFKLLPVLQLEARAFSRHQIFFHHPCKKKSSSERNCMRLLYEAVVEAVDVEVLAKSHAVLFHTLDIIIH